MTRKIDWRKFIFGYLALVTITIMVSYAATLKKGNSEMTRQELKQDMELFCGRKISDTDPEFLLCWHYYQKGKREGHKEGVKTGYKQGYEKGAFMKPIENGGQ